MIYIGLDGDDVGRNLERYFIENDEFHLSELSNNMSKSVNILAEFLHTIGCNIIFVAGDNILCKGENIDIEILLNYLGSFNGPCTFSCGIGETMEQTYLALKYAKSVGKNSLVRCNGYSNFEILPLLKRR
jgi:hypothetical protein